MKKITWFCKACNVPLLRDYCENCGQKGLIIKGDLRPVFKEEIEFLESITGTKLNIIKKDPLLWANGRNYIINGEIYFKVLGGGINTPPKITYIQNEDNIQKKVLDEETAIIMLKKANNIFLSNLTEKTIEKIRNIKQEYPDKTMIVSFSGGKDSTVVSHLAMRALGNSHLWHAFGDTTLEFKTTYDYIKQYKEMNKIPFIPQPLTKANGDFYELCDQLGVPSRIQRWCCSIFKTSTLGKAINWISKGTGTGTLTFDGIRSSESTRREGYEEITADNKIGKQILASPIKEWLDIYVWVYILTNSLLFNKAYRYGYTRVGCIPCPFNSGWSEMLTSYMFPEEALIWHKTLENYAMKINIPDINKYIVSGKWKARAGGLGLSKRRVYVKNDICEFDNDFITYDLSRDVELVFLEYLKPLGTIKNLSDDGIKIKLDLFTLNDKKQIAYIECIRVRNQIRIKSFISTNKSYFINYFTKLKNIVPLMQANEVKESKVKINDPHMYFITRFNKQVVKFQACHFGCGACKTICPFKAINGNVLLPESIQLELNEELPYKVNDKKCTRCMSCIDSFTKGCIAANSLHVSKSKR